MNYTYKGKLYTIRKVDIKNFQQYEGKWYPTVFYENEEGLRFNRSARDFFDKFEMHGKGLFGGEIAYVNIGFSEPGIEHVKDEYGNKCLIYGKCDICGLKKDLEKTIIDNVIISHCESCNAEEYYKEINKSEPIPYSTPKTGKFSKSDQDFLDKLDKDIASGKAFLKDFEAWKNAFEAKKEELEKGIKSSSQPWPLKEEKVIKEDEYLKLREIGFMNNIKVMPLKYTGGRPSSGACKKCEFYKNERCELFENEIDTFCTRLEREDHTTIFYKKVNDSKSTKEPQDLISLVLEKMPFLDSEKFEILNNNDCRFEPHITVDKINSPLEAWHVYEKDIDVDLKGLKEYFNLD